MLAPTRAAARSRPDCAVRGRRGKQHGNSPFLPASGFFPGSAREPPRRLHPRNGCNDLSVGRRGGQQDGLVCADLPTVDRTSNPLRRASPRSRRSRLFAHYNFCRIHETLRTTSAIALGITGRVLDWRADRRRAPDRSQQFRVIQGGKLD
jgi:hypothetical protein